MSRSNYLKLAIALAVPQIAGIIGSIFTADAISGWYRTLARPELAPPSWVFAPVWTTLFLLMGIAAFLVWRKGLTAKGVRPALGFFCAQLALNTLWSAVFFGMRNPGLALIEIGVLWVAIVATAALFYRVSRTATSLLIPYILWVSFAAYLNYQFWALNG